MTIWKHFSDPHKNQKISVNITDGKVNVVINDGGGSHYAQRITPPETYATKKKQEEIKKYILSMEGMSK